MTSHDVSMADLQQRSICSCFYTHNIFLRGYRVHVTYQDERQFSVGYKDLLHQRGCDSKEKYEEVLDEIAEEIIRRKERGEEQAQRTQLVKENYTRLHPSVYALCETFLHPEFIEVVKYSKRPHSTADGLLELINEERAPNVFSFPVFTAEFCQQLLEELDHFEHSDIPKGRPNTMNSSGILLSELGFDEGFMIQFRQSYLLPLARLLFPECVGQGLDSHRAFIVKYAMDDDVELSYHFDNAEVTLNVCLGRNFTGGALYFGPMKTERRAVDSGHTYEHVPGRGLLHRGQHMHGAHPITRGERYNLIIWMRASSVRNKLCPMCNRPPTLVTTEGSGDGFTRTHETREYCSVV